MLQGERERAADNKSLGQFNLAGIPPAPRGTPQIEVTFDIDANGILNVSAKDKATGKQQSIVIKASSGLSEAEVKRMIKDAEAHAEEDKRFHELVQARNQADALIHATRKFMEELGGKLEACEKETIESAIKTLEDAIKSDDKSGIEEKSRDLSKASAKMAERLYAQQPEEKAASAEAGSDSEDTVVDAEFEDVTKH